MRRCASPARAREQIMARSVGRSRISHARSLTYPAVLIALIVSAPPAAAAPGDLDPTFGGDGTVTTNFTHDADVGYPVALQPDGKIVVAGEAGCCRSNPTFALARYDPDGSLDATFGDGGKVTTDPSPGDDVIFGLAIQPDGKILSAGTTSYEAFALVRYESDGSLDTGFGTNGVAITDVTPKADFAYAMALQPDGKIVLAGDVGCCGPRRRFGVVRYNADGSLDTSFGGDGSVTTDISAYPDDALAMALQPDGKIVVAGGAGFGKPNERFVLVRYGTDGSLDAGFGGDGVVLTNLTPKPDVAFGIAVQPDGRIVAAGGARLGPGNPVWGLARYDADGSLDTSFDGDGKVLTDFTRGDDDAYSVAVQPDGRIVAAGQAGSFNTRFALARYHPDGSLDTDFGGDGRITTDLTRGYDSAYAVVVQPGGEIVAAGTAGFARFAVARYLAS